MNKSDVYSAISTVRQLMPEWFKSASSREAEGWEDRIGCLKIDLSLCWDELPDEYVPSNPQEYEMERKKFDQSKKQYAKQLAKLQERERRHQEITNKIEEVLPTICRFAYKININPDPLRRLFELKKLEAHEDAVLTLGRIEDVLAVGPKRRDTNSNRIERPRKGKTNKKPSEQLPPSGSQFDEKDVPVDYGDGDKNHEDSSSEFGKLTQRPTIFWLGDQTYRVGRSELIPVSEPHDRILQAFLNQPVLSLSALSKRSGLDKEALRTNLRRLCEGYEGAFKSAIIRPLKKGKGGYRATVIDDCSNRDK